MTSDAMMMTVGRMVERDRVSLRERAMQGLQRLVAIEKRAAAIARICAEFGWREDDPRLARFAPVMGATFSDALENDLLDHVLGGGDYTRLATVYAGLATAVTGLETGTPTSEVANSNAYARVSITNNATNWPAAASGAKSNGTAITFTTATGSWGTVSHAFLAESGVQGTADVIMWGALSVSKAIDNGDTAEFAVGDFDVTLD